MVSKKNTKKALLMSALSLLLCCSMLIGTTFAWFTDEVTSGKNQIIAGNLDVELEYSKDMSENSWKSVQGQTDLVDPNALWEPGHTEVVYLKVSNLGTLELNYQLGVNVISETPSINVNDEAFKLSEHLVFKAVELPDALTTYSDREVAQLTAGTEKGLKDYNGKTTKLEVGGEDYVALIVYMPETVGNEANYKTGAAVPTINLGINLFATQKDAESDSFGPDYDKDAWADGFKVTTAQDLQAAINNGETNIVLMDDIATNETIVIPEGATVALNLNGKTLEATNDAAIRANGNLNLTGEGTIKGNAGQYVVRAQAGSSITVNQGIVVEGGFGAIAVPGGKLIVNGGDFSNVEVNASHYVVSVWNNGEVIINGGTFTFAEDQYANANGAPVIGTWGGGSVEINGGTFDASSGSALCYDSASVVVKGGTFMNAAANTYGGTVSNKVASGFKAVVVDGAYYVVADNVAGVVTKPETLKDALSAAGAAGAGNTTIAFFGNIDMSGTAWTPIKVDGYHGADIVTIEGNGATITGLTAPLFAGGFAGGSGIVIKDLTIADSNIVSTNTIGSGAFIESVDSMALITLDNCNLVNSTVTGGSGSRTGGLIGWTAGYNNVNDGPVKTYVNITNCSVIDCTITCDGSVGGIYGHAGNNAWTYSTIENCTVKNCKLNSTDDGGWRVGVVVGTANVGEVTISNITESGNTLTQTGKTAPAGQSNLYGRFVPGTTGKLVIDGAYVLPAATQEALNNAISAGETEIALPAGTYVVPSAVSGKTVSIVGNGDTVIDITTVPTYAGLPGATITFENVIIKSDQQGAGYDRGFAHTNKITYNNCVINGTLGLNTDTEFNGCTFNISGDYYNLWTWGAENVTLNGCTFNSDGKALLLYGTANTKLTVNNCTFNDNGGLTDLKAAIEIGNDYHKSYELIVNNTVVNGYEINDKGISTGTTLWANKNSMGTDKLNVVVDGVDVY